jgi:hypothetical protein
LRRLLVGIADGIFDRKYLRIGKASANRHGNKVSCGVGTSERERGRSGCASVLASVLHQRNTGRLRLTEFSSEQKEQ